MIVGSLASGKHTLLAVGGLVIQTRVFTRQSDFAAAIRLEPSPIGFRLSIIKVMGSYFLN